MDKMPRLTLFIANVFFSKKIKIGNILIFSQKNNHNNDIAVEILKDAINIINKTSDEKEWKYLVSNNIKGIFLHNFSSLPLFINQRRKFVIPQKDYISQISSLLCASMLIRWANVVALNVNYSSHVPITKQLLFLSQYGTEEANDMMKGLESYYKNHHLL